MRRKKPILFLGAVVGVLVNSCSPYNYTGSGIQVAVENTKAILIDAPQVSCRSAHSTTPAADLAALSMEIGRLSLYWTVPPDSGSPSPKTLKLAYISIRPRSSGLTGTDNAIVLAGQDINCVVKNDPDASATLGVTEGGIINGDLPTAGPYVFPFPIRLGGFIAADKNKSRSFGGTASVLVYGLVHYPPAQDYPIIGRATFQFNFGGILQ